MKSARIARLIAHSDAVTDDLALSDVLERFQRTRHDFMAALNRERRVLGLCSRNLVYAVLGVARGKAIYGSRPVRDHLLPSPLIVDDELSPREILQKILARGEESFFEDLVVLSSSGEYLGLVPVRAVLQRYGAPMQIEGKEPAPEIEEMLERLRQAEGRYRQLFENHALGVALISSDGRVEMRNHEFARMFRLLEGNGARLRDLFSPDSSEELNAIFGLATGDETTRTIRTAAGAAALGLGDQIFRLFASWIPETRQISLCVEDVTERLRLERIQTVEEKFALVESLVGGVAHEISNKLSPILGFAELLVMRGERAEAAQFPELLPYSRIIRDNATEAGRIIRQLVELVEPAPETMTLCDLRTVVHDGLELLPVREKTHDFRLLLAEEPVGVRGDSGELKKVLMNLVLNALDAMASSEKRILQVEVHGEDAVSELIVRDSGVGISEEHQARVFDPFFSTKGAGTARSGGLGLSVALAIVKRHGGEIVLRSRLGEGAEFAVRLPRVPIVEPTTVVRLDSELLFARAEIDRVLVVDDEADIAQYLQETIEEQFRCAVEIAENGAAAVDLLKAKSFDLILVDLQMPVMTGEELFRWVKRHRPELAHRFLVITGGLEHPGLWESVTIDGDLLPALAKPFTSAELMRQFRRVVG